MLSQDVPTPRFADADGAPLFSQPRENPVQTVMRMAGLFVAALAANNAPDRIVVKIEIPASTALTVSLAAPPNAIVSGRLALSNAGAEPSLLRWEATTSATSCATPRPARWLEVEPAAGSLAGRQSARVAIYASSFAAGSGMRRGFLCIRSESAAEPVVEVPVTLVVEGSSATEP